MLPIVGSVISATSYSSAAKPVGRGEQRPTPPMPPAPEKAVDCSPVFTIPIYNKEDFKEIVITSEDIKVTFFVENNESFNTPEETGKLIVIADLIRQLNSYVIGKPVLKVRILDTQEYRGEYLPGDREIVLSKSVFCEEHYLHTIAHEMGHAIFCSMPKDPEFWEKLHIYSLGYGRYGLVADFNYAQTAGYYGHPFRNASELFASSFAAYVMHPDQLIDCMNDPGLLDSTGTMGKILYCYIRDNVFGGKFFGKDDPFKGLNAGSLAGSITEEDLLNSIASALHDKTGITHELSVAKFAAGILVSKAMKDERYFQLLAASAKDKDPGVRRAVILSVGTLKIRDPKFDKILIDALHEKDKLLRAYAETILEKRGIKTKRSLLPDFINAIF